MKIILETLKKKWPNYLLEIFVITIGILVAFMLNSWNEEKKDREQERLLLTELQNEFNKNLKELDEKIMMRNSIMESAEKLLFYSENGMVSVSIDTLSKLFGSVQFEPTFDPGMGVTEEIINSGKLYLILSQEVKIWITSWSSHVAKLHETEQLMQINVNDRFQPYLDKHYKKKDYWKSGINEDIIQIYAKGESRKFNPNSELKRSTFVNILNDEYIENFLFRTGNHAYIANKESIELRRQLMEILETIQNELNEG